MSYELPSLDAVSDRIGLLLVGITGGTDASGKMNTGSLLNRVSNLVCHEAQGRIAWKSDVIARRKRLCAHRVCTGLGRSAHVRANATEIVLWSEASLNRVSVREVSVGGSDARLRHRSRLLVTQGAATTPLDRRLQM